MYMESNIKYDLKQTSVNVDRDTFTKLQIIMLERGTNFSEWLRQKMREELRDEKIIESAIRQAQ